MVGKIIRDYMEGGARRLTVPGFGTFMRRDGGEIIFVDLLRGDDRVLAEMVERAGPFTEVEAMARIDRFIFETRDAVERTGSAPIAGFGTITADGKGVYRFDYSPDAVSARAVSAGAQRSATVSAAERTVTQWPFDSPAAERPRQADLPFAADAGGERSAARQDTATRQEAETHRSGEPQGRPAHEHAERNAPSKPREIAARPHGGVQAQPREGARTGGAHDGTTARHGGGARREPVPAARRAPADRSRGTAAPRRKPDVGAQKGRATTDRVLLAAIIAAAIALAAMIFGLTSSAGGPFVK